MSGNGQEPTFTAMPSMKDRMMAITDEVQIDLRTVASSQELHQLLMAEFGFPTWYGWEGAGQQYLLECR